MQIVGDFLGEDVGGRQVIGVFKAAVFQPEDVEVYFVPLHQFVVVERSPVAFGVLLGVPGGLAEMSFARAVALHELIEVFSLERVRFLCEVPVGSQVVDPQLRGPRLLLSGLGVEKQDVGLHTLSVEDAGRQTQKRVDVALLEQVAANGFSRSPFKQDVIGDDDRTAAIDLQQRFDVLQEVQLFVLG